MLLFRQARFTFHHVAGVLLKDKSKNASKTKNIFHLFKSDRTNYTTLWPKYRLRKAMELWAAIKELITLFGLQLGAHKVM